MSYYPNIGIPADHINFGISKVRETEWERHVRAYEAHERLLEELAEDVDYEEINDDEE